ncbi:Histidinol-phosphatase [bioreactor metagenome]|uniref:histidinol-phosphatase n=1 Tax=bioreactor metagenome TaxID=1076179 RepID=A0A645FRC8_9ZZZZ|nr:histidinol-phosphatase HisJ family protein [Candidatus Pelethousia sp.]
MFLMDYHLHSEFSDDCTAPLRAQLEAAQAAGLAEVCFTDHIDFDGVGLLPADLVARDAAIEALRGDFPGITIRRGAEVGLKDAVSASQSFAFCEKRNLDFIIASVHIVQGVDAYCPVYFDSRTQAEIYAGYLAWAAQILPTYSYFNVLGHYDFCAKFAPYSNRAFRYSHAPEALDSLFRQLVAAGKGMEVNTSAWREDPAWGLDVLRRYRTLGGEFVTVGSDAHQPQRVGRRIKEALDLARAAGIPYVATFQAMQPTFHRL